MPTYTVKLKSRQEIARETMAFHFEKPDDFYFKPGQTIDLTLIDPPESDAQGNSRVFSIASAPYERDLIIATRVRNSAFKRTLRTMAVGAEVKIEGPFGELTLHDNPDIPAVFLTGGIGITPFRSIVLQAANDKSSHHLSLFYSNRRPEEAAFLKELSGLESINRKFELVATMTQLEEDSHAWQDERGPINLPMLEAHLDHLAT
ncbi:MAG TPA: FAD-dependent oxidoreductase, partial [Blastocatellia bacterium]|nr:FAD-dependent oxidoreductase [Blastocatellia bacterium]